MEMVYPPVRCIVYIQVVIGRRRRSLPVSHKARIAKRIALEERRATQSENRRHKRQTEFDVTHVSFISCVTTYR